MKHVFSCLLLLLILSQVCASERKSIPRFNKITKSWASYSFVSIQDLQYVGPDSLHMADSVQFAGSTTHWLSQASPYARTAFPDTITTVGIVICPANVITYTANGYTMLLHDTAANSNSWGGILVREQTDSLTSYPDSIQAIADGFLAAQMGDVVLITGVVSEFPTNSMNSSTQFQPIYGISIEVIGTAPIPTATHVQVTDFNLGSYNNTTAKQYSKGEQWEGSLVYLTNLTVTSILNPTRGTWVMTDTMGNQITDYDISHYYTYGHGGPVTIPGDPSFRPPPIGAVIGKIEGTIVSSAGAENVDGYRICPLYPGIDLQGPSSISGTTFSDLNGNGVKDPGEPGMAGWKIILRQVPATTLTSSDTTVSDSAGNYVFGGLFDGTYTVNEVSQDGFIQTSPPAPGTYQVTITNGASVADLDFGNAPTRQYVGSSGGSWSNPSNWQGNLVPADTQAVELNVPVLYDVTVPNSIGALKLDSGATLTFSSTAGSLTVKKQLTCAGDWLNHGTFVAGQSTVVFAGDRHKSIDATPFWNLTIAGDSTHTLDNISIGHQLSLNRTLLVRPSDTLFVRDSSL
ncbi:MAG: SdrD B-like domain-containing protein, partial [Bacteroidota bacterium]